MNVTNVMPPSNGDSAMTPAPAHGVTNAAGVRKRGRRPRPRAAEPEPSREAKQRAAAVLDVLAGSRTPTDAARSLDVSLMAYYLLEERALKGLLSACAPRPRGPGIDPSREVNALRAECERWKREHGRQQALVRAAQRTIGLAPPAPVQDRTKESKDGKRRRKPRRPVARALRRAERLRQEPKNTTADSTMTPLKS